MKRDPKFRDMLIGTGGLLLLTLFQFLHYMLGPTNRGFRGVLELLILWFVVIIVWAVYLARRIRKGAERIRKKNPGTGKRRIPGKCTKAPNNLFGASACRKTMSFRASAPQRRAKSRLRRLRSARGLRAVWRGNLLDFRTFISDNRQIFLLFRGLPHQSADWFAMTSIF